MKNPREETYNEVQIEDADCNQDDLAEGEKFELVGLGFAETEAENLDGE
jgi:hypothetical protein